MLDGIREGAVEKPYGRGLTLVAWCLGLIGTVILMVSPVAAQAFRVPVLVGGGTVLAVGAVIFAVCQLRG
jgi:hypothetical protein